jgi:hypothetical protein
MKKLLLLSLTILLFSCASTTEDFLNFKKYNYSNSIKEQIRNADCEELEVLREKFKFKNNKDLKPLNRKSFLGIGPSAYDSITYLSLAIYHKRKELKCRKKLKESRKLSK